MAVINALVQYNRGEHSLLDYSSIQENYSEALKWAKDKNSNAAVGQYIYIKNSETLSAKTYLSGPYIVEVIGANAVLTPLSKGNLGGEEITEEITSIKTDITNIKNDINDLDGQVEDLTVTIGKNTSGDTPGYGILGDIEEMTQNIISNSTAIGNIQEDLKTESDKISQLQRDHIKNITVNGVNVPINSNIARIPLTTNLSDTLNTDAKNRAVSTGAVYDKFQDIQVQLDSKASIQYITDDPSMEDSTILYIQKNTEGLIEEKIYIEEEDRFYKIGSDQYATKDVATKNANGLMSSQDKTKLDEIMTLSPDELTNILK